MPFDSKIYLMSCRGKTFIFIFFFNILICNRSGVHPRLPLDIRGGIAATPRVRLTLGVALGRHLAPLDEFSLGLHELVELLAGLGGNLGTALG